MINNGTIDIEEVSVDSITEKIYKFKYDHKKAIEGAKDGEFACTVIVDIPNTYLKSILDFFNAETFRFCKKDIIYSNEDRVYLDKTDSIIIGYSFKDRNKYFRKVLLFNQEEISVAKNSNGNLTVLKEKN